MKQLHDTFDENNNWGEWELIEDRTEIEDGVYWLDPGYKDYAQIDNNLRSCFQS